MLRACKENNSCRRSSSFPSSKIVDRIFLIYNDYIGSPLSNKTTSAVTGNDFGRLTPSNRAEGNGIEASLLGPPTGEGQVSGSFSL